VTYASVLFLSKGATEFTILGEASSTWLVLELPLSHRRRRQAVFGSAMLTGALGSFTAAAGEKGADVEVRARDNGAAAARNGGANVKGVGM
jgi:hypothetical protein